MTKYDYSKNPYDKETQRKDWERYRREVRAEEDLKSGRHASMIEISKAISNFAQDRRKYGGSL